MRKPRKKRHGKFRVWHCCVGRIVHCWHRNARGLRDRCCWCGEYKP